MSTSMFFISLEMREKNLKKKEDVYYGMEGVIIKRILARVAKNSNIHKHI